MVAKILDGKLLANLVLESISLEIEAIKNSNKRLPTLAVVLVGSDPASQVYVRNKKFACNRVGIRSLEYNLSDTISEEELANLIENLNSNVEVDGILVQLPLPKHINSNNIMDKIDHHKDVDGFHRYNMGSLMLNRVAVYPCTPRGIIELLDSVNYDYVGINAVIIGASNIVGKPIALELLNRGATVTVCNSKTKNVAYYTKAADLIVVAVGTPNYLTKDWVKRGAVVIDVGINRLPDGTLCGDVDFCELKMVAEHITPVPGGVGPMTIAMLIKNTMLCYAHNSCV